MTEVNEAIAVDYRICPVHQSDKPQYGTAMQSCKLHRLTLNQVIAVSVNVKAKVQAQ